MARLALAAWHVLALAVALAGALRGRVESSLDSGSVGEFSQQEASALTPPGAQVVRAAARAQALRTAVLRSGVPGLQSMADRPVSRRGKAFKPDYGLPMRRAMRAWQERMSMGPLDGGPSSPVFGRFGGLVAPESAKAATWSVVAQAAAENAKAAKLVELDGSMRSLKSLAPKDLAPKDLVTTGEFKQFFHLTGEQGAWIVDRTLNNTDPDDPLMIFTQAIQDNTGNGADGDSGAESLGFLQEWAANSVESSVASMLVQGARAMAGVYAAYGVAPSLALALGPTTWAAIAGGIATTVLLQSLLAGVTTLQKRGFTTGSGSVDSAIFFAVIASSAVKMRFEQLGKVGSLISPETAKLTVREVMAQVSNMMRAKATAEGLESALEVAFYETNLNALTVHVLPALQGVGESASENWKEKATPAMGVIAKWASGPMAQLAMGAVTKSLAGAAARGQSGLVKGAINSDFAGAAMVGRGALAENVIKGEKPLSEAEVEVISKIVDQLGADPLDPLQADWMLGGLDDPE